MPTMVVAVVLFLQNDIKRIIHYLSKRLTRHRIKKVRVLSMSERGHGFLMPL